MLKITDWPICVSITWPIVLWSLLCCPLMPIICFFLLFISCTRFPVRNFDVWMCQSHGEMDSRMVSFYRQNREIVQHINWSMTYGKQWMRWANCAITVNPTRVAFFFSCASFLLFSNLFSMQLVSFCWCEHEKEIRSLAFSDLIAMPSSSIRKFFFYHIKNHSRWFWWKQEF